MNFDLTAEQQMVRDTFARFLDENCTPQRLRAAEAAGFDAALWQGLAELGAFGLRVPEEAGGLGLGTFDAAVVLEEVGRTLASGPIVEAILAARLVAMLGGDADAIVAGAQVASLALHDLAEKPKQFVAAGSVAEFVVARRGDEKLLWWVRDGTFQYFDLASDPGEHHDLSVQHGAPSQDAEKRQRERKR